MDDGNGVIFKQIYKGINFKFVASNLTSGIGYSFKLSAVNFNGEGVMSDPSVIKSCVVPTGVMAPQLIKSTSTSVSLRWSQPQSNGGCSVTSYAIFRDDGANGDFSTSLEPEVIGNNPYLFDHVFILPASLTGLNVRFKLQASNFRGDTISTDFLSVLIAGLPGWPAIGP
jgi:hypothetical protein